MSITNQELNQIANQFLLEHFNMKLNVPIVVSSRMTTTLGLFRYYRGTKKPIDIRISKNLITYNPKEMVIDVLFHECVHYALFKQGKPYKDGERHFESTLKRLGVSSTRTNTIKAVRHNYVCLDCNHNHTMNMKGGHKKYLCSCGGKLEYIGQEVK